MTETPNIVLVFSDQQHWQAAGFVDAFFDTPSLDALAKESFVFDCAFCTTPQCSPSRSSLLTGFYPTVTGVLGNVGAAGGKPLKQQTIAAELQAGGYQTAYYGKWHLGSETIAVRGFDNYSFEQVDSHTTQRAIDFLHQAGSLGKPFALFVSLNNPHDIYTFQNHTVRTEGGRIKLPDSWVAEDLHHKPSVQQQFMTEDQGRAIWQHPRDAWEAYRDCYRSKVRFVDRHVGEIVSALKDFNLYDNTILIFTSDHGDMDTNHGLIYKGPFMYEHMMRVPLLIRVPADKITSNHAYITDVDVVNVDIVPTLRELCGLPVKPSDGESFAPLLMGKDFYPQRDYVIGQYYSKQRWVNPIRMLRTHDYKYNLYIQHGEELYNLQNDPDELRNLASDPAFSDVKMQLSKQLHDWIGNHNDPFLSQRATDRSGNIIP